MRVLPSAPFPPYCSSSLAHHCPGRWGPGGAAAAPHTPGRVGPLQERGRRSGLAGGALRMLASRLGSEVGQLTFLVGVGIGSTQPDHVVPKRGQQPFTGAQSPKPLRGWGEDLRAWPSTSRTWPGGSCMNTHRVVCEPLQDNGSGEGIAGRKGKVTGRSDFRPPSAPAHTRSPGVIGRQPWEFWAHITCRANKGMTTSI